VGSAPLIAPFKEGMASATIGVHLIFKRPKTEGADGNEQATGGQ
jgi:hypothetical protein